MINLNNPAHPSHSNHLISTHGWRAQRVWHHDTPLHGTTVEELLDQWHADVTEQCGFIDSDQEIWYINNIHESPRRNFLMSNKQTNNTIEHIYNKYKKTILGIFHTHPNNVPWPSPRDIVGWPNVKLGWRYFIVTENEVIEWELVRD